MNIIVCVKQVPDTTEVKIDPKTGTLIREGIPVIINPDDKAALEAAISLAQKLNIAAQEANKHTVTVISMGPPQAEVALKEAYAMGADKVILLSDKAFAGSDTWATSIALAHAIKTQDYDLIICGRQAIDGDTAQVGPQIAEHLNLPQVSYVTDLEINDNSNSKNITSIIVKKTFEEKFQKIRIKLPCLLTVLREMNEPRYMTISRIFEKKEVIKMNINDINLEPSKTGLKASPTQVKKVITKEPKKKGKVVELDAKDSAKLIFDSLKEKNIIG
jgi:electron transfer flavoprotein beta subunit